MTRRFTSAVVSAAVLLALAPAAHAGQASVAGGTLTYMDNPGEARFTFSFTTAGSTNGEANTGGRR